MTAIFVDTNVLVYSLDVGKPGKHERAAAWMDAMWVSRRGRLSFQVLQEFYVTVTEKLAPGLDRDRARAEVRDLMAWRPLAIAPPVLEGAWVVQDRFSISWWDALIVSAAQVSGCRFLLTEDLQDGQDLDGTQIVNPFTHPPETLLEQ